MTVHTTETKARRHARPRPEQHHHPHQGPERAWHDHRDLPIAGTQPVIARQAARDLGVGAHLAGENAFTYGLLYEREAHLAERRQADARKVWKRASRSRYRKWMN